MKTKHLKDNRLAIFGGSPVRRTPYPKHTAIGKEEINAAIKVLREGIISDFEGSNNEWFLGGKEVKAFEKEWARHFKCKYAISMNSATSGLMAAVGAAGIGPGDEVITTPWTMTATPTAILVYNAVPIFADIEKDTFCISTESIKNNITPRTKAIMPVHIYGSTCDMDAIMDIAKKHSLIVIEDAAQSPDVSYKGKKVGTIGHMGIHSLNCHKIIQTGEGGVVTTDDDELANRLYLIRNHAEAAIATGRKVKSIVNMLGWNYRLTELQAAIGRRQLKRLPVLLERRKRLVDYLNGKLSKYDGLLLPKVRQGCGHSFYRYALRLDPSKIKIKAPRIVQALNAEGMDFYPGYMPLNQFPLYQEKVAFGDKGCPFKCPWYKGNPDYSLKKLTMVSHMLNWSLSTEVIRPPLTYKDMDEIDQAFAKIWANLNNL